MHTHKNVFLLTIDCLGADKCWPRGGARLRTVRRLQQRGVTFRQAFSTTSSTTPSIASILTGQYPFVHGIRSTRGWSLSPGVKTLATYLKEAGYKTSAFSTGPLLPETRLDRGFDDYIHVDPVRSIRVLKWRLERSRMQRNSALLLKFVEEHSGNERPWFQWVHVLDLHNRWRKTQRVAGGLCGYEHALRLLDQTLSLVLEKLDFAETIVVVCADHGHFVRAMDHQRMPNIPYAEAHGFHIYEVLTHIPLILVNQGLLPEGVVVDDLVQSIDILRTLLSMLDLPVSQRLPGIDLTTLRQQGGESPSPPRPRHIYLRACGSLLQSPAYHLHGVRDSRWKYCEAVLPEPGRFPELYDLNEDPREQRNVYRDCPEVAERMRHALLEMLTHDAAGEHA
ncbi:MAG: sulfatase-like hydrolase/transferase [Pirellulales bacterium]|nr:sulfatase-like hydrolase/transferase [Pirellulales bacterium]